MNYSTAIFLVNPNVRAIKTSYEVDAQGNGVKPFVTYKSLDQSLLVGEYVAVPTDTRHKITVVRIEEIETDVDLESPTQLKWVIGPISTADYDAVVKTEAVAVERIKSAEARAKRDELAKKLLADNPDIQFLADLNEAPALAAPPSTNQA